MGWLLSYAFRGFNSKIPLVSNCLHWNPILVKNNSCSPFVRLVSYNSRNRGFNSQELTSCVTFARRLHDVAHHLKPRGLRRWIRNLTRLALVGSLGCTMYMNLETVPYTNRRHLVLFPSRLEKRYSEWWFERDKSGKYEGKILPPSHPDNVRVQEIAKEIIGAARLELRKDRHRGAQTAHVEEFKWEVIVVEDPIDYAGCYPGGKIFVHTSMLRACKSDAELAQGIGHEVAHAVARHHLEVDDLLGALPGIALFQFMPRLLMLFLSFPVVLALNYSIHLSLSRRNEREAEYIGLLLSASVGYDPRIIAQKFEKYLEMKTPALEEYLSTHPSIEKRAQLFTHPKVMEEALSLYKEALSQREESQRKALSQRESKGFLKQFYKFVLFQ